MSNFIVPRTTHVFVSFVLCTVSIVSLANTDSTTAMLEALESDWNQAHMKGDAATLDALWSDDLVVAVPGMPVMSKSDVLSFVRSGRMHFERYETSDIRVRVYGTAAVVTGRLQRTRTIDGKRLDDDWRFTKVYANQQGKWRVVAFHASEAAHA